MFKALTQNKTAAAAAGLLALLVILASGATVARPSKAAPRQTTQIAQTARVKG